MHIKFSFGCVLKHSLSAHLIQEKFFATEFELRIACSFCRKIVWTDVKFLDGLDF